MPRPTLSAFLIVRNEEKNIERCLKSLTWVDEIIVVDSFSTDKTLEICSRFPAKIIQHPFLNYSDQKNFALNQVTSDWALSIDADEVVRTDLQNEIQDLFRADDLKYEAYEIPRRSFIFGRQFNYSGTQNDHPVRLFRKNSAQYHQPIHEIVIIKGKTGRLKHSLDHFTYNSITDYLKKFDRYTTFEAEYLLSKQHRLQIWDWAVRPWVKFLKQYIFELGFRDGWQGYLFCSLSAWYVFVKYAKYRELIKTSHSIRN